MEGAYVRCQQTRRHHLCFRPAPFDLDTGEVVENASIERQTELVLEQMSLCLPTAGASLDDVLKCTVYCTSVEMFAEVNAVYLPYFPHNPPARTFVDVLA